MLWEEIIHVHDDSWVTYHVILPSPFCKDGYKEKMGEALEKIGWEGGMGGLTYRDCHEISDLVQCVQFINSYKVIYHQFYDSQGEYYGLSNIDVTVAEFLSKVKKHVKKQKKKYKAKSLLEVIREMGFVYSRGGIK
jgi:hypothetical protein